MVPPRLKRPLTDGMWHPSDTISMALHVFAQCLGLEIHNLLLKGQWDLPSQRAGVFTNTLPRQGCSARRVGRRWLSLSTPQQRVPAQACVSDPCTDKRREQREIIFPSSRSVHCLIEPNCLLEKTPFP